MSVSSQSVQNQSSYSSFDYSYGDCEGSSGLIANGVCDPSVNTAACGFDGGDCCECTCFVVDVPCNRTGAAFDCQDPDASTDCSPTASSTVDSTSASAYSGCAGYIPDIKNGYCNDANNNADCDYDGGDCCSCTCVDGLEYPCGEQGGGFDCQDPGVGLQCLLNGTSCEGDLHFIRDVFCDANLNNSECGYDGGDCCLCTCGEGNNDNSSSAYSGDDSPDYMCGSGGYDCLDPSAPTDCTGCRGPGDYIADGICDEVTNSLECEWDGGDCCRCTCVETEDYFCPEEFNCLDPDAPTDCETESSLGSDNSGCQDPESNVSDGQCNEETNTAVCDWDGGDCCECTCTNSTFSCGEAGYSCLDPTQDCGPSANITATTATSLSRDEVVGVLIASVVGYCFLGGMIVVALGFIRRQCNYRGTKAPAGDVGHSTADDGDDSEICR